MRCVFVDTDEIFEMDMDPSSVVKVPKLPNSYGRNPKIEYGIFQHRITFLVGSTAVAIYGKKS